MRRPIIMWFVLVFASLEAVGNMFEALRALTSAGRKPLLEVLGHTAISVGLVTASVWIVVSLLKRAIRATRPISLYLWGMLIIYPFFRVFRAVGLYLPKPHIPPEQLAAATTSEVLRYAVIIVLIVWVGLSKTLRADLVQEPSVAGR